MLKESLILRVLAISFVFLALPLLITIFVMFQFGYNQALKNAKSNLEGSSTRRSSFLIQIKPFSKSFVAEVAYFLDLKNTLGKTSPEDLAHQLQKINENLTTCVELNVLGPPKNFLYPVIASTNSLLKGTNFYSDYNIPHAKEGNISTFVRYQYYPDTIVGSYLIYNAEQIFDDAGQLKGVLLIGADIGKTINLLIENAKEVHPSIKYALIQKDSIIISSSNPSLIGHYFLPISNEQKKRIYEEMKLQPSDDLKIAETPLDIKWETNGRFFEFTVEGEVQIGYFLPAEKEGLSFVTYASKKSIFSSAVEDFLIIYNGFGLIILIGVGVSIWLSGKVAKPLKQLINRMQMVESGDLSSRFVSEPFGYEINSLGKIFNQTLEALLEHIHNAENYRIKKESYYKELEIGYEVQRELLPKQMPKVEKVQFSASFIPSDVAHGDFFDCVAKGKNEVFLAIADMPSGGISSSFYALNMRSLLRSDVTLYDTIEEIISSANALFCKDVGDAKICIWAFFALYDIQSHALTSVTAGNHSALIRRKEGKIETIAADQSPFGLRHDIEYKAQTHQLFSGDILLLYTKEGLREIHQKKIEEILKGQTSAQSLIDILTTEVSSLKPEKDILFLALYVD